jgi:SnoaL-like protein
MIVAGRLFIVLGLFGLVAGGTYWTLQHQELAGVQLLLTFFAACLFLGFILLRFAPGSRRQQGQPDTGLIGSADPERGAADEHGNIHIMRPTIAPFAYSLAAIVALGGVVYRDRLIGPWGIAFGIAAAFTATAIWYRNVSADARAALEGGHGGGHGDEPGAVATDLAEPLAEPGPANWFEQLRQAMVSGDPDWAAQAYATDAIYYEPTNPPHLGREAIRTGLTDFLKGHRELAWTVQRLGVDGNVAIVEWSLTFRTRDRRLVSDQPGVTVIEIGPGGIVYHRDYL